MNHPLMMFKNRIASPGGSRVPRHLVGPIGAVAVCLVFVGLVGVTLGKGSFGLMSWFLLAIPLVFRRQLWPFPSPWVAVVTIVCAISFPVFASANPYWTYTAALTGVFALAALGLNIQVGAIGIPNLAGAALMGSGAYSTAVLATAVSWPVWGVIIASVVITLLIGCVLYLPVIRTRGYYEALITLAFAVIFALILDNTDALGGPQGIQNIPGLGQSFSTPLKIGPIVMPSYAKFFYVVLVICVIGYLVSKWLLNSRIGANWNAVRDDEIAARCAGLAVGKIRFGGFMVGTLLIGLSGALYALLVGYVGPSEFTFSASLTLLSIVILGGLGNMFGSVMATVLLIYLGETLQEMTEYRFLMYGVVIVLVLLFAPQGLYPERMRHYSTARYAALGKFVTRAREMLGWHAVRSVESPVQESKVGDLAERTAGRAETDDAILHVKDAVVTFGGLRALDSVTITVRRGELLGVIGPNGSGKTTLFNAVFGLYPLASGSVTFRGLDITKMETHSRVRLGMARTFQQNRVLGRQSVLDNVHLGRSSLCLDEVREWLDRLDPGLSAKLYEATADLPLVERRRIELARALLGKPELLLLDEPTAGLSLPETARAMDDIRLARSLRPEMTIVIVEHDMSVIAGLCERVVVLSYGTLLADGTYEDVTAHPEVRAAYLGVDV